MFSTTITSFRSILKLLIILHGVFCLEYSMIEELDDIQKSNLFSYNASSSAFDSILIELDYLNLHLPNVTDADNHFVNYLLKQSVCPVVLSVGNGHNATDAMIFVRKQRHRAFVLYSEKLDFILTRYSTRRGVLFCILLDEPDPTILVNLARRLWTTRGVYKIYYISTMQSVYFNPFIMASTGLYGSLINASSMPIDDIFKDLHEYPIRTYIFGSVYSTVHGDARTKQITLLKGADGKVAKLLSNIMNFTMNLQWPDDEYFGARLENGSFNGAVGRMVRYETDITLTGFFVKDYFTRDIEFSVSVYMDELCCYVMKAKRIPQSIVPFFAIGLDIWVSFISVGIASSFIWILIRFLNIYLGIEKLDDSVHKFPKKSVQCVRIMIDTWVIWVRVNILKFPPFYSERVFIVSVCLVSVIYGALFESSLATVYIRPLYYKDINTMHELDEANLRIYIKHAAMKDDLFYGHSSVVYQNLDRKVLLVGELEERLINMMSKRGGFAAVTRGSSLVLDDIRYFVTNKIHKISECPKNYHIAYVFARHSAFARPINLLLLRFVEAGLIDLWIGEMKYKAKISMHKFPDYIVDLEYTHKWKMLTLEDIQMAFYALVIGYIFSFLALAGEKIVLLKFFR